METSNLKGTIRGPSPIAGAAGIGLHNGGSGPNPGQPQLPSPAALQTPKEALTYIDRLYKTGRMEEAAALLRRHKIFREAWVLFQRSFTAYPELPPDPAPAKLAEARKPEYGPDPVRPPKSFQDPGPAINPAYPFTQALRVYRGQLKSFDQERNSPFRISLRV